MADCRFPGCTRPVRMRGHCRGHQAQAGLAPQMPRLGPMQIPLPHDGRRTCACGTEFAVTRENREQCFCSEACFRRVRWGVASLLVEHQRRAA